MPDDRVYIHEVPVENVGHTPVLEVIRGESWAVQSEPVVSACEVIRTPAKMENPAMPENRRHSRNGMSLARTRAR